MHFAILLLPLFACAPKQPVEPIASDPIQEAPADTARVHTLAEEDLRLLLTAPSDRPRIVNFWASWCASCRDELPMLDAFAIHHTAIDVVLVSVDEARDLPELLRLLAPTRLRTFQLGPDPAQILPRAVPDWPRVIPVTLVLDPAGRELGRVVGQADEARILRFFEPAG